MSNQEKDKDEFTPDFQNDTCILIAFISHGREGHVYMKEDKMNIENDILGHFRADQCRGLIDKPKIFLFSVRNFF